MLLQRIESELERFARTEHFQFSEIEVDMLLITLKPSLRSIDVTMDFNGDKKDGKLEYYKNADVCFSVDLNTPDNYFEVLKEIQILEKGTAYKGIKLESHVHVHINGKSEPIMLGDGAKDGSVPSFSELVINKTKHFYRGQINIDFELNVSSSKHLCTDDVIKMFKAGKIEPAWIGAKWDVVLKF